jgi:hypothetical protein
MVDIEETGGQLHKTLKRRNKPWQKEALNSTYSLYQQRTAKCKN